MRLIREMIRAGILIMFFLVIPIIISLFVAFILGILKVLLKVLLDISISDIDIFLICSIVAFGLVIAVFQLDARSTRFRALQHRCIRYFNDLFRLDDK
jgi:hypothetical protein